MILLLVCLALFSREYCFVSRETERRELGNSWKMPIIRCSHWVSSLFGRQHLLANNSMSMSASYQNLVASSGPNSESIGVKW